MDFFVERRGKISNPTEELSRLREVSALHEKDAQKRGVESTPH